MRTKHLCVLFHIRIKGDLVSLNIYKLSSFFADRSKAVLLLWIILLVMFHICLGYAVLSAT